MKKVKICKDEDTIKTPAIQEIQNGVKLENRVKSESDMLKTPVGSEEPHEREEYSTRNSHKATSTSDNLIWGMNQHHKIRITNVNRENGST